MSDMARAEQGHGSLASYSVGFGLSILFTLAAYLCVVQHVISGTVLLGALLLLAIIQLIVQVVFFLHLGSESKPRWNLMLFGFMILVVSMIVIGSLWIMKNLQYNMSSPTKTDKTIFNEEAIHE